MPTAVHALMLAGLLTASMSAPPAAPITGDTTDLQFLGFRAGATLDELSAHLQTFGSKPLRCRRSKVDIRVSECRAVLSHPDVGGTVDLWVSAIDSVVGVMTLSGMTTPTQLSRWREALQQRYGMVGKRVQGTQSMLQWVRRGRMLRLTWRLDRGGKVASVSLVDGHVLDDWGRARSRTAPARAL